MDSTNSTAGEDPGFDAESVFGEGGLNSEFDESELFEQVGLDPDDIDWRKQFLGFDESDVERLESLDELFADHADEIARHFYDNLTEQEATQSVIDRSPKDIESLEQTQKAYWLTLTDGDYGTDYFRNRARIGKLHEQLEMPVEQYVGQYGFYFGLLFDVMAKRRRKRVTETLEQAGVDHGTIDEVHAQIEASSAETLSVLKLLTLDMQVAMETYVRAWEADLREEIQRRREIAEGTQEAVTDLKDFASEVSKSSKRISDLTDSEAGNVDEIRDEMSSLSATTEEIAATANQVEQTSMQAVSTAKEGQESAKSARNLMGDIEHSAKDISSSARDLEAQTEEIDEIVAVINEIADQTNMLALNASIEAARAGEKGDGFAVVADEVKSLAEEAQTQAGRIEETIDGIRGEIENTVENAESAAADIDEGIDEVEDAMVQLDEIVRTVEDAANGVAEVSVATDDQAQAAEEIATKLDEAANSIREINEEINEVAKANEQQTAKVFKVTSDLKQLSEER